MLFVSRSIAVFASSTAASGLCQANPALSVENNTPLMTTRCLSACVPKAPAKLERFNLKIFIIAVH
jgi:hypothetical protein